MSEKYLLIENERRMMEVVQSVMKRVSSSDGANRIIRSRKTGLTCFLGLMVSINVIADGNETSKCGLKVSAGEMRELNCSVSELKLSGTIKGQYVSLKWYPENGGNISEGETSLTPLIDAPGTYVLSALTEDGCVVESRANVELNLVKPIIESEIKDAECGPASGSVSISVSGGEPPYRINWFNGSDSPVMKNLSAGIYRVKVEDSKGCVREKEFEIKENLPLTVTYEKKNASCNIKGAINLAVAGGAGDYIFHWTNGSSTQDIDQLEPGEYGVSVVDANGCQEDLIIRIEDTEPCSENGSGVLEVGHDALLQAASGISPLNHVEINPGTSPFITELLNVFPNPADQTATVEFSVTPFSEVSVEFFSIKGAKSEVLFSGIIENEKVRKIDIDLSAYSKGAYLVIMRTRGKTIMNKLIITK